MMGIKGMDNAMGIRGMDNNSDGDQVWTSVMEI